MVLNLNKTKGSPFLPALLSLKMTGLPIVKNKYKETNMYNGNKVIKRIMARKMSNIFFKNLLYMRR